VKNISEEQNKTNIAIRVIVDHACRSICNCWPDNCRQMVLVT
jgi:hypothetical protein